MESNKEQYVENPQTDFTRKRKVTFYDMMWFLLFIGANSMSEEIRRAFNYKDFSYISEAAMSRSKIKVSAFEQLFHKFNDTLEKAKKYKDYRVLAVDGSDFSSLYSADSKYATISNQYGGANRMHVNFAYDILNKNQIPNLSYLIRIRSGMTKEIAALPDKELDLDLNFEVRTQTKRQLCKMKIQAWDMELPATVSFRLVKVRLQNKWLVLATNLSRDEFSARTLKNLYEKRWKIELAFRDIKHALGTLHFHSKKDLFNLQEFFAHLIRYNLTTKIISQVHLAEPKNLKYHYEINFKNAAQVVQDHCRRRPYYKKLLEQIKHYIHSVRGNRLYRRNCHYFFPVAFNYRVA